MQSPQWVGGQGGGVVIRINMVVHTTWVESTKGCIFCLLLDQL